MRRFALFALFALTALGCGSSPAQPTGDAGGPVPDAADQHCVADGGMTAMKVGMCLADTPGGDAGAAPAPIDYGATLYNGTGYDDDCKYQVSFTSTPIRKGAEVTFTLTVNGLDPAGPALGAAPYAEVYLTDIHPAPNSNTTTTEKGGGVYEIGPVVFDASGTWTIRFHVYEMCSDTPADSPHGHAAFYIQVP